MTRKQQLLATAKELGIKAFGHWTIAMIEKAIKSHQRYNSTPTVMSTTTVDKQRSDPTNAESVDTQVRAVQPPTAVSTQNTPPTTKGLAGKLSTPKPTDNAPHLIVEARAGTGKTTTLIEGLKYVMGETSRMTPSPQQKLVWKAMELSKGIAVSVCMVAFNKAIAEELKSRVPRGVDAMTMHSMGYKAVREVLGRQEPNNWVVKDYIANALGGEWQALRAEKGITMGATEKLISLCKNNLLNGTEDDCYYLTSHYEIDFGEDEDKAEAYQREAFSLVPLILERCRKPLGKISFDDMIWLPVVLNLPIYKYDLLLVDEAQDLNRCQQELAKRAGKRLILCGDPRQAIYGFAGADCKSMDRMGKELNATDRNCTLLPLTVTRRCGKAIVEEAKKLVPDFEAFETNPEGKITYARYELGKGEIGDNYRVQVQAKDMVLCRVNAPLVSQCFKFLKEGKKANIQGRDIGEGIIQLIKRLKAKDVPELIQKLEAWRDGELKREQASKHPNEMKMIAVEDKHECLICFTEGAVTIDDVVAKINTIFTDDKIVPGIRLSSIHKAKGLEASRVFFIITKDAPCPHPMARSPWAYQQDLNLKYVGITRAIEELIYVN